jgi:hypothetical protein
VPAAAIAFQEAPGHRDRWASVMLDPMRLAEGMDLEVSRSITPKLKELLGP